MEVGEIRTVSRAQFSDSRAEDANRPEIAVVGLSIICVNWNSLDYLQHCIRSIYSNPPSISFEIIVVDNASPEGGIEKIHAAFPAVKIIKSAANLGFAGANNIGFAHCSGSQILLLNPDTEVMGAALDTMLDAMTSLPDAGIVGCKLLNSDLSTSTTSIQAFPTILNQLLTAERLRLMFPGCWLWNIAPLFSDSDKPIKVDVIPGACILIRRNIFERVGGLSEQYFMYAEDIDLNYKVRKIGYSSYYTGQGRVIHHGGKSSSQHKVSQWSTVMTYRAMLQFYRTNRGHAYATAYRLAMGGAALIRLLLLGLMFPFGNRQQIRWSSSKWATVLKWAIGHERLETATN